MRVFSTQADENACSILKVIEFTAEGTFESFLFDRVSWFIDAKFSESYANSKNL